MKIGRALALLISSAALALGVSPVRAATIVNVDGTSAAGATLFLDAGTYDFSFIGTSLGGAYDAVRGWSSVAGCNLSGSNCSRGWLVSLAVDLGNGGLFDGTNGLVFGQAASQGDTHNFATSELAIAQAQTGNFLVGRLSDRQLLNGTGIAPLSFTLSSSQAVKFSFLDSYYQDNSGGISLALSAVPEPATWAMMLAGFGAVGFAMRRRTLQSSPARGALATGSR